MTFPQAVCAKNNYYPGGLSPLSLFFFALLYVTGHVNVRRDRLGRSEAHQRVGVGKRSTSDGRLLQGENDGEQSSCCPSQSLSFRTRKNAVHRPPRGGRDNLNSRVTNREPGGDGHDTGPQPGEDDAATGNTGVAKAIARRPQGGERGPGGCEIQRLHRLLRGEGRNGTRGDRWRHQRPPRTA